jgi:hypothetical protein
MFWNKSVKLPVTEDDKEWVEEYMLHLRDNFGAEHFDDIQTVLPNREFYNIDFTGTEEDAYFILEQTKIYMSIENDTIRLKFFSDSPLEMDDGTILTTPFDFNGTGYSGAAGTYEEKDNRIIIAIERKKLKDPPALIATIAHELAHYILLGENRLEENDEYLTDLLVIVYGFGIFLGNIKFRQAALVGRGWEMSSIGYLPEQVIAYAMAWLCAFRKEEPVWKDMLNASMLKYFNQSFEYIQKHPDKIRFE